MNITNLLPFKLGITRWIFFQQFWDDGLFQIRPQRRKIPVFSQANLMTSSHPQASTHLETAPNIASPPPTCRFLTIENVFFSNLTNEIFPQLASSCSINHFLRRFRAFDGSSNRNDFSKALAGKKVCKSSWGAVAYQSSWKHPWWPANCIKWSSTLQIAERQTTEATKIFSFLLLWSRQKLKVKMLWATEETCKTQKKHWHRSDWPSEASLGDFAHPFLVPPLPVDASFVGGMWGCVMGVMSITCMLKKSFKINLFSKHHFSSQVHNQPQRLRRLGPHR